MVRWWRNREAIPIGKHLERPTKFLETAWRSVNQAISSQPLRSGKVGLEQLIGMFSGVMLLQVPAYGDIGDLRRLGYSVYARVTGLKGRVCLADLLHGSGRSFSLCSRLSRALARIA